MCYGILLEIAQIIGEVLYFVVVKDLFMPHHYFWCKRSRLKFAINLVLCWWRSDGNMLRGRKLSIEWLWGRVEMECFEILVFIMLFWFYAITLGIKSGKFKYLILGFGIEATSSWSSWTLFENSVFLSIQRLINVICFSFFVCGYYI